jgi:hypothetical protein
MTTFPRSPRVLKGAIVALDPFNPLASVIVFQYNPERLSRTLTPQMAGEGGEGSETLRLKGPPQEDINVTVEIDATDQLEKADAIAVSTGIYPQLAALEMLLYPKSAVVLANALLAHVGVIEVVQPEAPLTLFVWGVKRVLPVRLTSLSIDEQLYDVNLNPIRASVTLSMRVLTYNDLPQSSVGYGLSMAHQVVKETMATIASTTALSTAGIPRLL